MIRSSIIGPDHRTRAGLYSWFQGEAFEGKKVKGFSNHLWNGVSTTAFARLAVGLAKSGHRDPFQIHWVPVDTASKLEVLRLFAENLGVSPELIQPGLAPSTVDRTLATDDAALNQDLWRLAGYDHVPTIRELVAELVALDKGREIR